MTGWPTLADPPLPMPGAGRAISRTWTPGSISEALPVWYAFMLAFRLTNAGWSWGYTSLTDSAGQMLFNVDAHCANGRRYIVRTDELLTAFLELEATFVGGSRDEKIMRVGRGH